MDKKVSFVTTTINIPKFIEGYLNNARKYGHSTEELEFIVIGDLKSPSNTDEYCKKLQEEHGFNVEYLGPKDQLEWLDDRNLTELKQLLPFNSLQRRNIGFLRAYERGGDVIVSLDDDNYVGEKDVVKKFGSIGETQKVYEVSSSNNWFNCCSMLNFREEDEENIYPRGFPYSKRDKEVEYRFEEKKRYIAIRGGLWLEVPDVDVITHLERGKIKGVSLKNRYKNKPVSLSEGNYCPVNTQNTGFEASMLPLIYAIPMGDTVKGMTVSRFDDIWLGFFAEKILDSMDEVVAYGEPLSHHKRNFHNTKGELEYEAIGIRLNEIWIDLLKEIKITGETYLECYKELITKLRGKIKGSEIDYEIKSYFMKVLNSMEIWFNSCKKIMK